MHRHRQLAPVRERRKDNINGKLHLKITPLEPDPSQKFYNNTANNPTRNLFLCQDLLGLG